MLIALATTLPLIAAIPTRDEEEFVTELRNLPEGWLGLAGLALLLALCWAVIWMYRREGRIGASKRVRMVLAGLRCAVIVALAVILLEPARVRILRRWVDSYTIVLLDDSSSMDLRDRYGDPAIKERIVRALPSDQVESVGRRATLTRRLLERGDRALLRGLAANNRVKVYSFNDEPVLLATVRARREAPGAAASGNDPPQASDPSPESPGPTTADKVPLMLAATGATTNIDRAVRRSVESVGAAPVAGIVVISDGGFNQGATASDVARYARDRRIPIFTVGVGDPSPPQNIRVAQIIAPKNAFKQDPFAISAELASQGMAGRTIQVELRQRSAATAGEGRVIASRNVVIESDSAMVPVTFQHSQNTTGRFVYTITVLPLESEAVLDDNSKQTTVTIIESRSRILVVSGGPSWEYRYVTRLLQRDDTFDVSCWLQSADLSAVRDGNTVIDHLPREPEELFAYDVVVLMDPDKRAFDHRWCRLIDTLVTEHGGGFLLTASRAHTPDFLHDSSLSPIHDLLPVTLDPQADLILNRVGHYQRLGAPLIIPDVALGHSILTLAEDVASTKLLWQRGADLFWHYPVLKEKPVATVLMRHGDPRMANNHGAHVLAAVQFVGAGRTGFIGFDGTWRWRRQRGGTERFNRFWVQMIRYLAEGKLLGGAKRGTILTDSEQFSLGETVTVTARLFNAQYEPIRKDQVTAYYSVDGRRGEFVLRVRPDRPGWFEGHFVPDRTGSYRLSLTLPDPSARDVEEISKEIRVSRPNIEIIRPQMDRAKLVAL
ncbi:MAG: VWA domain-containing protein, partial [Planctomycetes bacterium]|nr:VWA domain-containing protein [Planctomycetota bacterium]